MPPHWALSPSLPKARAPKVNVARQVYAEYGKGRRTAGLKLGDCFACTLVEVTGEPLLLDGNDFDKTDVTAGL